MQNILIPTTFEADTLQALKVATDVKRHNAGRVVLLSLSAVSDSIIDLLFLSPQDHIDTGKHKKLKQNWHRFTVQNKVTVETKEHHQFGMSRPILTQLLERFDIDMAIVPLSFQQSRQHIHRFLLKLLHESHCPLMLLPTEKQESEVIQRALFLDNPAVSLTASIENLPFHIIHQSMLQDQHERPLKRVIDDHRIDLIVLGKRNNETSEDNTDILGLGIPVLTI